MARRRTPEPKRLDRWTTLAQLRDGVHEARQKAKNLASNLQRIEAEYSDFEDTIRDLEAHIQQAKEDHGITEEEIMTPEDPSSEFIDLS